MFLPHPRVKISIVGSFRDREVACSASDRQGSNFESCVWRTVSSHHPQEVLLAQFSLYVHKGGLKPDSFHFLPAVHSCPNELYNIHGDTHSTIKVTVQSEHEPYQSNGDMFDTNQLLIIRNTLRTLQYRSKKCHLGRKVAESVIPHRIFCLQ